MLLVAVVDLRSPWNLFREISFASGTCSALSRDRLRGRRPTKHMIASLGAHSLVAGRYAHFIESDEQVLAIT